jgi:hypothetical protein
MRICLALVAISCAGSPTRPIDPKAVTPTTSLTIKMKVVPAPVLAPITAPLATTTAITAPLATTTAIAAPLAHDVVVRTVQLAQTTTVRKAPRGDAAPIGVVGKGTRTTILDTAPAGNGCASHRWIEIAPRGWLCENLVDEVDGSPTTAEDVALASIADDVVPGTYGFVHGAGAQAFASRADAEANENGKPIAIATSVRALGVVGVAGRRFWLTSDGLLIDDNSIYRASPSTFKGVVLAPGDAMPAWVKGSRKAPVKTTDRDGRVTGTLEPRSVVSIVETSNDGKRVRIADDTWIARADVHVATSVAPPDGTGASERWFDVDLDDQVLVAYEGSRPVYATLVSTGKWGHETPTSVTRIASKHLRATMSNDKGESYSVADVPWTMYYDHNFALHTSYWHDGFGAPRSHGCVNLAPRDARVLFYWSSPDVPPGWQTVYADEDVPGSLVRVRSRANAEPAFRGYARTLHDRAHDQIATR